MASQPPNVIPLIVITLVVCLAWVAARLAGPVRACRRCHGTGRVPALREGVFTPCRRCHATGFTHRTHHHHRRR